MVQRYELSEEWGTPVLSEYDHGEWVKYEDYATLEHDSQQLAFLIMGLTDAINISELPDKLYSELEARGLL